MLLLLRRKVGRRGRLHRDRRRLRVADRLQDRLLQSGQIDAEHSRVGRGLRVGLGHRAHHRVGHARLDVILLAGRYTLLEQNPLDDLFPACEKAGTVIVVGGPYNSGLLAGGTTFNYEPAKPDMVARSDAIRAICQRHGTDIKAAALQFCAAHPVVAAAIPGPRTAAEVQQNAALMQAKVPSALWSDLRRAGLLPENAPAPGQ